jgi:hypothetical protein
MVTAFSGIFKAIYSQVYESFMNIEVPPLARIALVLILV